MPERNARHFLKDKEAKALLDKGSGRLKADLRQILAGKPSIEVVRAEIGKIFLVNGRPLFFEAEGILCPTLFFSELLERMPKAIVDMGAIPYLCKGADVMAPGIRRLEGSFSKGDIVAVVDEKHRKAVAIGEAMLHSEEALKVNRGVVVKNIHFVSDKAWNRMKELQTKV
jgi:PUA-domain protein